VAFASEATNLVPDDMNALGDAFLHNTQNGVTSRASVGSFGEEADNYSYFTSISSNGRYVSFGSAGTNLVPDDTNGVEDGFVHDFGAPCENPALWSNYGIGWPGTSGVPGLTASNAPELCQTVTLTIGNSLGLRTLAVLFVGMARAELPTAWGGTLLLVPVFAFPLTLPSGSYEVSVIVPPCDPSLCDTTLDLQVLELDWGATRNVSFTQGLELVLGS
jgi:hypothetical protein